MKRVRYSGATYQLGKGLSLNPGQEVLINGPHDTYGRVIKQQESGYYLIRGVKSVSTKNLQKV